MNNNINESEITLLINNQQLFNDINVFNTLESTNITAKELANNDAKSGTVVVANEQTAGKGRLGRSFYSPQNSGIYMSIILRLDESIDCSLLITSGTAVGVCRAIENMYNISPQIKWVNDIYINDKKICGILTEASINFKTNVLDYIIVGIGINLTTNDFPIELKTKAGSLNESINVDIIPRNSLIAEVLNQLEIVCNDLKEKTFIQEYKNRSCVLGCDIKVINGENQEIATAIDINEFGHLIVKTLDGNIKELNTGEISIIKI